MKIWKIAVQTLNKISWKEDIIYYIDLKDSIQTAFTNASKSAANSENKIKANFCIHYKTKNLMKKFKKSEDNLHLDVPSSIQTPVCSLLCVTDFLVRRQTCMYGCMQIYFILLIHTDTFTNICTYFRKYTFYVQGGRWNRNLTK